MSLRLKKLIRPIVAEVVEENPDLDDDALARLVVQRVESDPDLSRQAEKETMRHFLLRAVRPSSARRRPPPRSRHDVDLGRLDDQRLAVGGDPRLAGDDDLLQRLHAGGGEAALEGLAVGADHLHRRGLGRQVLLAAGVPGRLAGVAFHLVIPDRIAQ